VPQLRGAVDVVQGVPNFPAGEATAPAGEEETQSRNHRTVSAAKRLRVTNMTRGTVLAAMSKKASNPVSRGIGLMGRRSLPDGGGLLIQPCNGVVSFFMRFPIDVVFLDRDAKVCHMMHRMVPWRASKIVRGSKLVVELPAGTLAQSGTEHGDTITIAPAQEP
jgi:uncharacterized membrane protein (UPF0127 family)